MVRLFSLWEPHQPASAAGGIFDQAQRPTLWDTSNGLFGRRRARMGTSSVPGADLVGGHDDIR